MLIIVKSISVKEINTVYNAFIAISIPYLCPLRVEPFLKAKGNITYAPQNFKTIKSSQLSLLTNVNNFTMFESF